MAANARFESHPASSSNGKRGTVGLKLDRSGSFREGTERTFSSGFVVTPSGGCVPVALGNLPTLSQCLSLEPIPIGDLNIDRLVELKRVMGLIVGGTSEENCSGAAVSANSKPSSPLSVAEDLKRLRSSVVDTCNIARGRASKLDEHLHKLDKYCVGVISKKIQRNELMTNDQAGALNSKIGTQISGNPTELVNQRVEDRPKNVLLNKRVRTSVAETRAECRSNGLRRQPGVMAEDRDVLKKNDGESDISEEKILRFPAGGEGWDKKMKRKRSVGMASTRSMDNNEEPKRTPQNKAVSEPMLQSNNTHAYSLGASNGTGTTHKMDNKLEGPSLPNGSRARLSPRNELEEPTRDLTGGSNKQRLLTKGNNKLNTRDDNYLPNSNLVTKGKASRTPRIGAIVAASSSPSTPCLSGTPESWENLTGGNKIPPTGGARKRKRDMPSGSSSPGMARWGGQRPQKMSRTRRSNLVSPVSNQEEKPLSSESCSHSDVSVRLASDGTNGPLISKLLKPKIELVQSPQRLHESEESVGGQDHGKNVRLSLAVGMKVNSVIKEESGEDVKRQGRSGRGPLIARASSSVTVDKLDNTSMVKPIRSNKPSCEKNGSKAGRPFKKLLDRKGFSRLGHLQDGDSNCTGKSADDREELLAAANHARSASYLACSSAFWKKMEPIFAPVSSKDKVYLSTQLKEPDIQESFPQFHGCANNVVPKLDNKEDETIKQEINQLKTRLRQQNYKKKAYLEKICKSIGSSFVGRDLEQLAIDKLVELAYRKLLATRGPSRGSTLKIPKHVAMAFGRRTLARCRKFGKSGVSCFNVAPLRDILFAPQENELESAASAGGSPANTSTKYIGFQNPHPDSRISSDEAFASNGPISNRGKKKELLLDDVGNGFGGTMGDRAYQGARKLKANPAGQLLTSGNGCIHQSTRSLHPVQPSPNGPNHNRDIRKGNGPQEMSKENMEITDPLHDLDPIDELGVGGPQDLSSLLNFDEDELQDDFSAGLEIPMDDLTELNMF